VPALVDCTVVNDEVELLRARLRHLDGVVDRFVVVEARQDFRGRPKPAHVAASGVLDSARTPVTHLVLDDLGDHGRLGERDAAWAREKTQRDALTAVLDGLGPTDVVIVADVDELPSREACEVLRRGVPAPVALEMEHCIGFLDLCTRHPWALPFAAPVGELGSPHELRFRPDRPLVLRRAGWHLSYLGGPEAQRRKLGTLAHTELDRELLRDERHLRRCARLGCHPCGTWKWLQHRPLERLPASLREDPYLSRHVFGPRSRPRALAAFGYALAMSIPAGENWTVNRALDTQRSIRRALRRRWGGAGVP
jgi:beta-1,4-mannosyl-glycoprotein beta-1,4-N-acetylglucosaminyltransferase